MTTAIHLATPDDADKLLTLIEAFHAEYRLQTTAEHRSAAIAPLLEGSPLGAAWLFGMTKAPVGYTIITFSWSIELGGMDAFVDELYIRPNVRNRGIASEALSALSKTLREAGVKALHLEVKRTDQAAQRRYARAHFQMRDRYTMMTRLL